MSSAAVSMGAPRPSQGLAREAWARVCAVSPRAAWVGVASVAIGVLAAAAALVGPEREILGVNGWLKPAKFAGSFGLYALTVLWLLSFIDGRKSLVRFIAQATAWGCLVESAGAAVQVARGTTSHFNVATPPDQVVYYMMAGSITLVIVTAIMLTVLLVRQPGLEPVFGTGLRLGIAMTLIGMLTGIFMVLPSAEDLAAEPQTRIGAHSVGAPDGGPGLALFNWNTESGDLRVAHFAGLHGAQLLPLLAWALGRRRSRFEVRHLQALVWTAALTQLGLVALLLIQALRAEPVTSPGRLTLALLWAVLVAGAAGVVRVCIDAYAGARRRTLGRIADGATWFIAVAHAGVMLVEVFLWNAEPGREAFGGEEASEWVAQNLGLYNGLLGAGLVWGLTRPEPRQALAIKTFFLACIAVAGVFGSFTFVPTTIVVQTGAAAVALALQGLAHKS